MDDVLLIQTSNGRCFTQEGNCRHGRLRCRKTGGREVVERTTTFVNDFAHTSSYYKYVSDVCRDLCDIMRHIGSRELVACLPKHKQRFNMTPLRNQHTPKMPPRLCDVGKHPESRANLDCAREVPSGRLEVADLAVAQRDVLP